MSELPDSAAGYFGALAQSYDSLIHRALPRYDEMIDQLVESLPGSAGRVLELGCGTGTLTVELARRYPAADLVYVDASREMLEATGARLAAAAPELRARGVLSRFEELAAGGADVDLVVSSISMHHVADKGALYRLVFGHLRPGGAFHWADQLAAATPRLQSLLWERWLEFCRLPGNCSHEEIAGLLEHARAHDHYEPLAVHFRLLREAGFHGVDCLWRSLMWTVVTAEKPGP